MHRPIPELRPAAWLATAPATIDWRDAGGGLVGSAGGPGYSVEAAGRVLMERHISDGRLILTVRPASAVTGGPDRSLRGGVQIGSPAASPTGWLATVSPLLELDGHLTRLLGDRPVYFPAAVEHLLVLPAGADMSRGYLWAAMTWRLSANPVTPLAMTLGTDRLDVHRPATDRPDHRLHLEAERLAVGHPAARSNYHGESSPRALLATAASGEMNGDPKGE